MVQIPRVKLERNLTIPVRWDRLKYTSRKKQPVFAGLGEDENYLFRRIKPKLNADFFSVKRVLELFDNIIPRLPSDGNALFWIVPIVDEHLSCVLPDKKEHGCQDHH